MVQHFSLPTNKRTDIKFSALNTFFYGAAGFLSGFVTSVLLLIILPRSVYPVLYKYDHGSWYSSAFIYYVRYGELYVPALVFGLTVGLALAVRRQINLWSALTFTLIAVAANCAGIFGPALVLAKFIDAFRFNPLFINGTDLSKTFEMMASGYLLGLTCATAVTLLAYLLLSIVGTHKQFGPLIALGGVCGIVVMLLAQQGRDSELKTNVLAMFYELWQMSVAALIGYFIDKSIHEERISPSHRSLL